MTSPPSSNDAVVLLGARAARHPARFASGQADGRRPGRPPRVPLPDVPRAATGGGVMQRFVHSVRRTTNDVH